MSRKQPAAVPNWASDYSECPAADCDGYYWTDVGGSAEYPRVERVTSCGHEIGKCVVCGCESVRRSNGTPYSWPVAEFRGGPGTDRSVWFCSDCHIAENVSEIVPLVARSLNSKRLPDRLEAPGPWTCPDCGEVHSWKELYVAGACPTCGFDGEPGSGGFNGGEGRAAWR